MKEVLKAEINKYLLKSMKTQTVKGNEVSIKELKAEIESIGKIKTEENHEMKHLGTQTRTSEDKEQRNSGIDNTIQEIDTSIKGNVKSKNLL